MSSVARTDAPVNVAREIRPIQPARARSDSFEFPPARGFGTDAVGLDSSTTRSRRKVRLDIRILRLVPPRLVTPKDEVNRPLSPIEHGGDSGRCWQTAWLVIFDRSSE